MTRQGEDIEPCLQGLVFGWTFLTFSCIIVCWRAPSPRSEKVCCSNPTRCLCVCVCVCLGLLSAPQNLYRKWEQTGIFSLVVSSVIKSTHAGLYLCGSDPSRLYPPRLMWQTPTPLWAWTAQSVLKQDEYLTNYFYNVDIPIIPHPSNIFRLLSYLIKSAR